MWRIAGYGGDEEYGIGLYFQFIEIRVRNPPIAFYIFSFWETISSYRGINSERGGDEGGWGTKTRSGLLHRRAATGGEEKTRVACGPGPRPFGP